MYLGILSEYVTIWLRSNSDFERTGWLKFWRQVWLEIRMICQEIGNAKAIAAGGRMQVWHGMVFSSFSKEETKYKGIQRKEEIMGDKRH
ncbi:hypothetical protein QNH46_09875 [Paenibacillus woosongensis]|uniref:Uncharacterized protein n=1 Tax=Paenibacillus woosongensis TaxID=307580 RepID=A0AA95KV92_9BACL|nr:hypothetical protein [Paenibacillus woosongensis]WHX50918.1 hypothetical protein QNH46_09875 [Paenibacillus woosongensis]